MISYMESKTRKIIFIASEIAIVTGHNKYEKPSKVLDKVLNRSKLAKRYIPKSKVEESLLDATPTDIVRIKKELKLDEQSTLQDIEKVIKKTIINRSLNENISEERSKQKIDEVIVAMPVLSKCLEGNIKQDVQMRRGNIKENRNLDKTQILRNIVIGERNSKMYNRVIYKNKDLNYEIVLRGKVDGMNDEYVVETKNRTKRLFHMIPGYEKVQLTAYMFMTNKAKSLHIECYNDEQNQVEYDFDERFWEDCCEKIIEFTHQNVEQYLSS